VEIFLQRAHMRKRLHRMAMVETRKKRRKVKSFFKQLAGTSKLAYKVRTLVLEWEGSQEKKKLSVVVL